MKSNVFALVFGEIATFYRVNPSDKIGSEVPILPAPFTQGSQGRSRARGFFDTLKPRLLPRFFVFSNGVLPVEKKDIL